jgi:hypothetical protein
MAVNVPSSDYLFNDLISVEVAENRIRQKKTSTRSVKTKEKTDPVPQLSDFISARKQLVKIWPQFPPINMSFKPIELYDPRSVTLARRNAIDKTKKLLQN